jgi:hypothetical protein
MNRSRIKRFAVSYFSVALFSLLASCANELKTGNVQLQNASLKGWNTFAFLPDSTAPAPNTGSWRALISQDILSSLNRKRYRYFINRRTDKLVAFHITLNDNEPISTLQTYSGYKFAPGNSLQIEPAKIRNSKKPGAILPGTLVVDLIDTRSHQLIWRSWINLANLQKNRNHQILLKSAIDTLLAKIPER